MVAELNAQLDEFQGALGCLPRFIDGHQHVHQFPVIRDALVGVYEERLRHHQAYIRVINGKSHHLKMAVIKTMGTTALTGLLKKKSIPYNTSFSGLYSFSDAANYDKYFPLFLAEIGDKGLIMCHPGLPSSLSSDAIRIARSFEYQYLAGLKFQVDCATEGVVIDRFSPRCIVLSK
jgi:predicted glycoside hydrolase/deacetylase ChbG (UPF0249 family)